MERFGQELEIHQQYYMASSGRQPACILNLHWVNSLNSETQMMKIYGISVPLPCHWCTKYAYLIKTEPLDSLVRNDLVSN